MARTDEGTRLTEAHRRRQLELRTSIIKEVTRLYPMWELRDSQSWDRLEEAIVSLTKRGIADSAAIAAAYYEAFRAADLPGASSTAVVVAETLPEEQIRKSIRATAQGGVYRALRAGKPYQVAMDSGLVQLSGSVTRLSLAGGRNTITRSVVSDARAVGWERVTGRKPCAFCAMLASRGPIYKSVGRGGQTPDFKAHDHCSCSAEPIYAGGEWGDRNQEFNDLWYAAQQGRQKGESALNAFRRFLSD